ADPHVVIVAAWELLVEAAGFDDRLLAYDHGWNRDLALLDNQRIEVCEAVRRATLHEAGFAGGISDQQRVAIHQVERWIIGELLHLGGEVFRIPGVVTVKECKILASRRADGGVSGSGAAFVLLL